MPSARERGLSHPNLMLDVGYERVRGAISNIQLAMISGGVKNYRKRNKIVCCVKPGARLVS